MKNENEILNRMNIVISDILDLKELSLSKNMVASDIEGWDSLNHINIIVAMENEFNIKFTLNDIKNLKNIGDLIQLVENKI